MASFLRKSSLFSHLRFNQESIPNGFAQPNRGYHIDYGAREKALLEEDPALSRFKSYKKGVKRIKRIGDVLTIVVVAGCCYEIYVRATMQEEATKQEAKSAN